MSAAFPEADQGSRPIRFVRLPIFARRLTITGTLVALSAAAVLSIASPAGAGTGEGELAAATNSLRAANGLPAYRVCSDLTAVARNWAAQMAARDVLAHNPSYETQVTNWLSLGENVGTGQSVPVVQQALAASPGHRANMLSSRFVEVGYGTAIAANGRVYVDEVFRLPRGAGCTTATAGTAKAPVKRATPTPTRTPTAVTSPSAPIPTPALVPMPKPPRLQVVPADEDSIGRAFEFHEAFATGVT